jgi:hypothetical protein
MPWDSISSACHGTVDCSEDSVCEALVALSIRARRSWLVQPHTMPRPVALVECGNLLHVEAQHIASSASAADLVCIYSTLT